jgi:hypothetical protein
MNDAPVTEAPLEEPAATPGRLDRFVKTYRYLRVGMVGLVVLLGASLMHQLWVDDWHLLPSISDYYYTPVQAVFVSALVAIGVCMIVLKGNTPWEDTFLNLAGMLSPVVAFVPTPEYGTCGPEGVPPGIAADIANNVWALLVAGAAGVVATFVIARRSGDALRPGQAVGGGLVISTVLLVAGALWFFLGRASFSCGAHFTSAIVMFVFIIAVVAWNAWSKADGDFRAAGRTAYGVLAPVMIVSAVGLGIATWQGWISNGVFWIELTLITLFATFWVIQSIELWSEGVRSPGGDQTG